MVEERSGRFASLRGKDSYGQNVSQLASGVHGAPITHPRVTVHAPYKLLKPGANSNLISTIRKISGYPCLQLWFRVLLLLPLLHFWAVSSPSPCPVLQQPPWGTLSPASAQTTCPSVSLDNVSLSHTCTYMTPPHTYTSMHTHSHQHAT